MPAPTTALPIECPMGYRIEYARPDDLASLEEIQIEAASLFPEEDVPAELRQQGIPLSIMTEAAREERLWIAVETNSDATVGFALAIEVGHWGHLAEVDVLPAHGRRGIGRALVATVIDWALKGRFPMLTLTTFRHLAWNAPFYASLGFTEFPVNEWPPEFAARVKRELGPGIDPAKRVAMRLPLPVPR